jgi:hypothetical protein
VEKKKQKSPWDRAVLEKAAVAQQVTRILAFYGSLRAIYKSPPLNSEPRDCSNIAMPYFSKIYFNIILAYTSASP